MRKFRSSLMLFSVALYVLLGIAASWHAPHFTRGPVAIGVDAHSGSHETALDDDSCALCSTKKVAQEVAGVPQAVWRIRELAVAFRPIFFLTVREDFGSDRARAPPVLS